MEIYKKMEPYFKPNWIIEILLLTLVTTTWLVGCLSEYVTLSILAFAFTQVVVGWLGHSAAHSRDPTLNKLGRVESSLIGGLSLGWWSPKHNMHHMFTNI
jgi:fatty acid desaturase